MQHQIARNLTQAIAEKENSHEKAKLLAADAQFLVHRQGGKPDVNPVQIGDDVQQEEIRKNPDLHLPDRLRFS